jgi:hypothetical protein
MSLLREKVTPERLLTLHLEAPVALFSLHPGQTGKDRWSRPCNVPLGMTQLADG